MPESQLPHVGDVVATEVTHVAPFGAFVKITDDISGLLVSNDPRVPGTCLHVRVEAVDAERR
ncbi:MAG: S1 RNA-binding domain-containing protein, partial [Jiangellaceae bacterium]|nr:S1 RNA-binding domain-containing protein [Jiangellaceae bacterium]